MLKTRKTININGQSLVDGVETMNFSASIDCSNPSNTSISAYISNQKTYKEHRIECRKDQAEFEEYVYALQDEMLGGIEDGTEE